MILKINNLEIELNKEEEKKSERIKKIIEDNYTLLTLILTEEKGFNNFDECLDKLIYDYFNDKDTKKELEQKNVLDILNINYLLLINDNIQSIFKYSEDFNEELLNTFIAYIYYQKNKTFKDFTNYLKNKTPEEAKKIYNWLEKETKKTTYNYILKITKKYLEESGYIFTKEVKNPLNIMLNEIYTKPTIYTAYEYELEKLTENKIEELFYEFLCFIDAPQSWYDNYQYLKEKDRIEFLDIEEDNIDEESCTYLDDNDNINILITHKNNTRMFCDFVHEFIHSVSMSEKESLIESTRELPSIFFESIAAIFLYTKGYSINILKEELSYRKMESLEIARDTIFMYKKIKKYMNKRKNNTNNYWNNQFSEIELTTNLIKESNNKIDNIVNIEMLSNDEYVYGDYDNEIEMVLDYGYAIKQHYQYLLGSYITNILLNRLYKDDNIIPNMINITNNLNNLTLEEILNILKINSLTNNNKKILKKK